jgi:sulfatase maturation enzyme AslB (radical SAM superfamily)
VPRPGALVRSRFLVRVPREDGDAVVFHSLYGTSLVLNPAAEAVLDLFGTPTTLGAARAASHGDPRPAVATLVARRFLIDPAADERAEFSRCMRPAAPETGAHLRDLVLLAAEQCNLACPYCIKDRLMDLRPERPQARIAGPTARAAIDAFLAVAERSGHRDLGLQFRGGEALLNAGVVLDAIRHMRARWTRGAVHASMVSNATLVTAAIARALAELRVTVEVSIDGPRAVHDAVRVTRGGRPTYERVVAGLARLRAAGVDVPNVNATVTAETLASLDASFFADLARLGVRHLNLEPDVLRPAHPDPHALAARLLELREAARAHGIELSGCWGRALRALTVVGGGAPLPPPADYPLLIVDARGHVVPWEYNGVAELGPVTDLAGVLASEAFRGHVESRTPGRIPECVGCEVEGLCQGNASMTLVYERATGRSGLFAHRCELIRAMTRGVLAGAEARDARPGPGPAPINEIGLAPAPG